MSKYRKELNNRRKPNIFQRLYRKFEIFWEGVNELDFSSVIPVTELGLDESLVVHGAPSCNKYLIRLFKELNITEKDSILDIGCAKGGGNSLYE